MNSRINNSPDVDLNQSGGRGAWQHVVGVARIKNSLRLRNAGVVYTLIVLVAVFTFLNARLGNPGYLRGINLSNIVDEASLVGIVVTFATVVLISGNFDLSVGSIAAFGAVTVLGLGQHHPMVFAIFVALAAGAIFGLVNGLLVQIVGVNAFIVTLGSLTMISGLVLVISNGQSTNLTNAHAVRSLSALVSGGWRIPDILLVLGLMLIAVAVATWVWSANSFKGTRTTLFGSVGVGCAMVSVLVPYSITLSKTSWYWIILTALTWLVLNYTTVGRRLYAVGGNAEAARLSGIGVNRYKIIAFVLSGASAAFMGVLFAAQLDTIQPTDLSNTELVALAAAVLGGTSLFGGSGSVIKSMYGTFILFVLQNGFDVVNIGPNYQNVIQGAVIIVAAASYVLTAPSRRARRTAGASSNRKSALSNGGEAEAVPVGATPPAPLTSEGTSVRLAESTRITGQ